MAAILEKSKLALLGGQPVRTRPFAHCNTIGAEEKRAVAEVMDTGVLSEFVGVWTDCFNGGPRVRGLEREWADYFGVKHAITINSNTSGLFAAVGALGIGPGDEVIVSPYTMSASAIAPLVYGATPVFADIDPVTYCLSPASVRARITPRTKAILAVDIFGHPAEWDELRAIANGHKLGLIEDAAQIPGGKYKGRWAGGLGDIGIFSLNYHKTIHCGEGGVAVTNDDHLAERLRLIRNHAETVVKAQGDARNFGLIGFNYRMTELHAAIASEQLKKLEALTAPRIEYAGILQERWGKIPGLQPATCQRDCRHVYYVFATQYEEALHGVPRAKFLEAVKAEGVALAGGYVEPLYLQPIYQQRVMHCGPTCRSYDGQVSYARGLCPTTELMHFSRLFYTPLIHAHLSRADVEDVALAVEKVIANISQLK